MTPIRTRILTACLLLAGSACTPAAPTQSDPDMEPLRMTSEWDKTFPLSEQVDHRKITFRTWLK